MLREHAALGRDRSLSFTDQSNRHSLTQSESTELNLISLPQNGLSNSGRQRERHRSSRLNKLSLSLSHSLSKPENLFRLVKTKRERVRERPRRARVSAAQMEAARLLFASLNLHVIGRAREKKKRNLIKNRAHFSERFLVARRKGCIVWIQTLNASLTWKASVSECRCLMQCRPLQALEVVQKVFRMKSVQSLQWKNERR